MLQRRNVSLRWKSATLAVAAFLQTGCGDRVTLRSADGLHLAYACDDIPALAQDSSSIALVRAVARDLLNVAGREGDSSWGVRIEAHLDQQDVRPLEREIVLYMCDTGARPDLWDRVAFPDSGSLAPGFRASVAIAPLSTNSAIVALEDHRGRVVLLDFWASWCIPCLGKQRYVAQLAAKYQSRGLHVYGVLVNDRIPNAQQWLQSDGDLAYPFLLDERGVVAEAYGVNGIPRMFLIGPDGRILGHCFGCGSGPLSPAALDRWLDRLLAGEQLQPTSSN